MHWCGESRKRSSQGEDAGGFSLRVGADHTGGRDSPPGRWRISEPERTDHRCRRRSSSAFERRHDQLELTVSAKRQRSLSQVRGLREQTCVLINRMFTREHTPLRPASVVAVRLVHAT
jgi:hypothetical protein